MDNQDQTQTTSRGSRGLKLLVSGVVAVFAVYGWMEFVDNVWP